MQIFLKGLNKLPLLARGALPPLVDQWDSVTPLAGIWLHHLHANRLINPLIHSVQKLHKLPLSTSKRSDGLTGKQYMSPVRNKLPSCWIIFPHNYSHLQLILCCFRQPCKHLPALLYKTPWHLLTPARTYTQAQQCAHTHTRSHTHTKKSWSVEIHTKQLHNAASSRPPILRPEEALAESAN